MILDINFRLRNYVLKRNLLNAKIQHVRIAEGAYPMHARHIAKPSDPYPVTPFPVERRAVIRKTRFWTAIAVAALLLLGIAGWANTMLNAKNLPTQELYEGLNGL
jgi:hypothetical protein